MAYFNFKTYFSLTLVSSIFKNVRTSKIISLLFLVFFNDHIYSQSIQEIETICGIDDTKEAKCYQFSEPIVYEKSKAVARLWRNGQTIGSGFLIGSEGHLMTNAHVANNINYAKGISVEMMAEGSDCNVNCKVTGACQGTIVATTTKLIQINYDLDYALLELPVNVTNTYGYLQLKYNGPNVGERIYHPQHPLGWGKRIGVESDNINDPNGNITVQSLNHNPICGLTNLVSYFSDTQFGASGSPVLSYEDHSVIAVHTCNVCPNSGTNSDLIIHDLNYTPNDAIKYCGGLDQEIETNMTIFTDQKAGDILIKNGGILTVTSIVEFGPFNKLIIEQGGKLILDGGKLTSCDNNLGWQGIQAFGNPFSTQFHAVELKNGAVIENAKMGISTSIPTPYWPYSNSGAKITSENSTMRNCGVGVNFGQYGFSTLWSSYGDQSQFVNTTFSNCGTGVILKHNLGVEFSGCSFIGDGNAIGIDVQSSETNVTGCEFDCEQGIFLSATWPNLGGSSISNNSFLGSEGIILDAQGNATPHQILGNFFISNVGLSLLGQSAFNIQANDFANNATGVASWNTGDDFNIVSDNGFLGNEFANSTYGDNNIEYNDNCFDFSSTADIELYDGASIFTSQGDAEFAAGNCFSLIPTKILTGPGSVSFDYFVKNGTISQSCKKPGYGNFIEQIALDEYLLNCGSGVWTTLPPKYRNCIIPNNLKDKKLMEEALKTEIQRIRNDNNIPPGLKKWLLARYERCLKKLKGVIGLQIIKEEQNGKELAIEYFSNQDLFSHKIMAYAIMMESGELVRGGAYLNGLNTVNSAQNDFVFANSLYLSYLTNREEFVLGNTTKDSLRAIAMESNELSGYARSIYYTLTGERLRITLSHTNHEVPRISSFNNLSEGKISSYPNPVMGNEHIVAIASNDYYQKYVININDITGRIMKSVNGVNGENTIDMTDVINGIYILEVISGNDRLFTTKVVRL